MKVFYTTDGSIDQELQQICPFGELYHFERNDGTEYTMPIKVGSIGCIRCKHCYGAGFQGEFGGRPEKWVMIPSNTKINYSDTLSDVQADEARKINLKHKQFTTISEDDYIKCSMWYNENFRNKNIKLKTKLWLWHHIGIKFHGFCGRLSCKYIDLKVKINDLKYKLTKMISPEKCEIKYK